MSNKIIHVKKKRVMESKNTKTKISLKYQNKYIGTAKSYNNKIML